MRIDLRPDQAAAALQGLLKSLYGLGFQWVVRPGSTPQCTAQCTTQRIP